MTDPNGHSLPDAFARLEATEAQQQSFEEYVRAELKHLRDIGRKTGEALDLLLAHYGLELEGKPDE